MQLDKLKKNITSLGNSDIDFFMQQVENLNIKTDIEIVFSGTISNGKSTLINGLLEIDLLPMKLGATTSFVTTIQRGEDNIVAILDDGSSQNHTFNKSSIDTISKNSSVESIDIFMKDFPYTGIKFVDTPGIDDISTQREGRTFNYVPLADIVVFVVDASKGLTAEEKLFFENKIVRANKDKIFIVLNKIDMIPDEEIEITKLLSPQIANEYNVYQISALKYLVGILKDDSNRVKESGVDDFKDDLDTYLKNLDKSKIFKKRMRKSLENILNLANIQIDTLIDNVSRSTPEIEATIKDVKVKIEKANIEKAILENEIDSAIDELKKCLNHHLNILKSDINITIKDVTHKEFMIDKFNDEIPILCDKMVNHLKECHDEKFKDLNIDFLKLDDLYLLVIRNIDDVIAQLVWLLTFVPKVGKIITPFVPKIQESVRRLADMFGGKIIESRVELEIGKLLDLIEKNINQSVSEYKNELLVDYEHKQLGAIRSELISLESLLKMNENKKENTTHQVNYYKNNINELNVIIKKLLLENNK